MSSLAANALYHLITGVPPHVHESSPPGVSLKTVHAGSSPPVVVACDHVRRIAVPREVATQFLVDDVGYQILEAVKASHGVLSAAPESQQRVSHDFRESRVDETLHLGVLDTPPVDVIMSERSPLLSMDMDEQDRQRDFEMTGF